MNYETAGEKMDGKTNRHTTLYNLEISSTQSFHNIILHRSPFQSSTIQKRQERQEKRTMDRVSTMVYYTLYEVHR